MEREIKIYETQNKTGNKVLDTILTSKSMHCQRHGIELKFMGEGTAAEFYGGYGYQCSFRKYAG